MCKHACGGGQQQDTGAAQKDTVAMPNQQLHRVAAETVASRSSTHVTMVEPVRETHAQGYCSTESSPMLCIENSQVPNSSACALSDDYDKVCISECAEQSSLLQDSANADARSKKRSRWRSGVVVYPSVASSLTTEWKDDLSQFNSLTNLGSDLVAGTHGECSHGDQLLSLKDCQVYNVNVRPRSMSLTQVNNSFDQYIGVCSNSTELDVAGISCEMPVLPFLHHHHKLIKGLQYSSSVASSLTDGGNMPICKICHLPSSNGDPLISPCRCSGTMQFIHCNCLMKWLEYSSKRTRRPPTCELCQYQYHWHKKFKVGRWQFPHCSQRDKLFHITFFLALMIMIACATITILCFKQDKGVRVSQDSRELTDSEIVTLVCGVLFFIAFFLAMYVQVKARNNVYRLFVKFLYLNQQWYFDEYDKKDNSVVSV